MPARRPVEERSESPLKPVLEAASGSPQLRRSAEGLRSDELHWADAFGANGDERGHPFLASLMSTAAAILAAASVDEGLGREEVVDFFARLAERAATTPEAVAVDVGIRALRDPHFEALTPRIAAAAQTRVLYTCSSLAEVTLWALEESGRLQRLVQLGPGRPTRRVRTLAKEILAGTEPSPDPRQRKLIHAEPITRHQQPVSALVVRVVAPARALSLALTAETARALAGTFDRETLLRRSEEREQILVASSERRLSRLGLDLHDGAMQDVASLASDLRLFREQLRQALGETEHAETLLGRIFDLEARLEKVDVELREIAQAAESSTVLRRPLRTLVTTEAEAFSRRTGISVSVEITGNLETLSASQQIALFRIIQEGLTNVREHSGAEEVRIRIVADSRTTRLTLVDNGQGFDVEPELMRAATKGRLGLVGMSERARLLGGRLEIESTQGGPTTLSLVLPAWRPLVQQPQSTRSA